MIKILLLLAVIVATLPFNKMEMITIEWLDFHIEISFTLFVAVIIVSFFLIYYFFKAVNFIKNIPAQFKASLKTRNHEKEIKLLNSSIKALINNNDKLLSDAVKKINALNYDESPFKSSFLLLLAQRAEFNNESAKAEEICLKLLEEDPSNLFALKTLFGIKINNKQIDEALLLARRLEEEEFEKDSFEKIIEIYDYLKMFKEEAQVIDKMQARNLLNDNEANALNAKLYYKQASLLKKNDKEKATEFALKALKFEPSNILIVRLIYQLYSEENNQKSLYKLLVKVWKEYPTHEIAELILELFIEYSFNKKVKLLEDLIAENPEAMAGYIALANFYLSEGVFLEGVAHLKKLLQDRVVDSELAKLMAILEAKSNSSYPSILNWLNKI